MKAKYILGLLFICSTSILGQTNLLSYPSGFGGGKSGVIFADDQLKPYSDRVLVVGEGQQIYQTVKLDNAVGKIAVISARVSMDEIATENLLTGYPLLHGYLLSAFPTGKVTSYMTNQESLIGRPTVAGEWVIAYGIFEIPAETSAAQIMIGRASRRGEKDNGSPIRVESAGLYLFDTKLEATNFVAHLKQSGQIP